MWVITTHGFFSAVEKPEDRGNGTLTVRARNEEDIRALAAMIPGTTPTQTTRGHSDYEWRLRCTTSEWAVALARMALEINYSNFKTAVGQRQGKVRAGVYGSVWSVLLRLERRGRYGGYSGGYGGFDGYFPDEPLFRDPATRPKRRR